MWLFHLCVCFQMLNKLHGLDLYEEQHARTHDFIFWGPRRTSVRLPCGKCMERPTYRLQVLCANSSYAHAVALIRVPSRTQRGFRRNTGFPQLGAGTMCKGRELSGSPRLLLRFQSGPSLDYKSAERRSPRRCATS